MWKRIPVQLKALLIVLTLLYKMQNAGDLNLRRFRCRYGFKGK